MSSDAEAQRTEHQVRADNVKASIESISAFVELYDPIEHVDQVPIRLEKLESLYDDYVEHIVQLQLLPPTTPVVDYAKRLSRMEAKYYQLKAALTKMVHTVASPAPSKTKFSFPPHGHVKFPELKLPEFSGNPLEWHSFRDRFNAAVHSADGLRPSEKFQYLKGLLKNEAAGLIAEISISDENYAEAWKRLNSRYDDKRVLVKCHLAELFDTPSMKHESTEALLNLVDRFDRNISILNKLGEPTEKWSTILVYQLGQRLHQNTLREWENHVARKAINDDGSLDTSMPQYFDMIAFLQGYARVLQAIAPAQPRAQETKVKPTPKFSTLHIAQSSSGESTAARKCLQCSGDHYLHQCFKFRKLSPRQRLDFVKQKRLCLNCMKTTAHGCMSCSSGGCRKCGRNHHTLLHLTPLEGQQLSQTVNCQPASGTPSQVAQQQSNISGSCSIETNSASQPTQTTGASSSQPSANLPAVLTAHSTKHCGEAVLLCTALVHFHDCSGVKIIARVLLDSCSQFNLITDCLCQKLKLPTKAEHVNLGGVGQLVTSVNKTTEASISSRNFGFAKKLKFLVLPTISSDQPVRALTTSDWHIPNWVTLADPTFNSPGTVDALIGAGTFFELLRYGKVTLGEHLPLLQNTILGWIVSGECTENSTGSPEIQSCHLTHEQRLEQLVARFWELEQCTPRPCWSPTEQFCEQHFVENVSRTDTGRYVVRLPMRKELLPRLRDNRFNAQRRFLTLERKLDADPALRAQYEQFMNEYLLLGHMREVSEEELAAEDEDDPRYLMPHLAVLRPESTTTQLRTVFDASCKSCSGLSLNDVLLVGPTIQDTLLTIVIRFRTHAFVLGGDLEKMYRQILVHAADQPLQRIYWRKSSTEPLKTYQLLTVTYGTNSAPFLATRVLQQLADDEESRFRLAAPVVRKDMYMDDLLTGCDDLRELKELTSQLLEIFRSAGMQLRKISSNSQEVLQNIPADCRETKSIIQFDNEAPVKALGLLWEPSSDSFLYKQPKFSHCEKYTKRILLSQTSTFFDPLGVMGPAVVKAKILIQTLWKLEYDWDQQLPAMLAQEWEDYQRQFDMLQNFRLPRHVMSLNRPAVIEVHGFCDASTHAYGACIYMRTISLDNYVTIRLLTAKSRIATLDSKSITRLELCAALLLARLLTAVIKSIGTPGEIHLWTDSMVVLHWLSASPSTWDTFVGNRVAETQELTTNCNWHHIPGTDNPADIISRGMDLVQLVDCSLWWNGPSFLGAVDQPWPQPPQDFSQLQERDLERRKGVALPVTEQQPAIISDFSSFNTFLRISALCRRFVNNCRALARARLADQRVQRPMFGPVTVDEINEALAAIVRLVHQEHFASELTALQAGRSVPHSSPLRYLNPELHNGIIRVGGRLKNAAIAPDAKNPIVLPKAHPLTRLIAETTHRQQLHCGPQLLLATIRQRFWPLGGRNLVRTVVHSCIACVKARPRNMWQLMGSLPAVRVTPAHVFENVGVDFAGPFYLRRPGPRAAPTKSYVAIFVCMTTKAAHLELVCDLTTAAFIGCLRRFVARRGRPRNIYCDNATNFLGANRELRELRNLFLSQQHRHAIVNEAAAELIKFHFIPAKSPSYGGLWEACVKSMKYHLRRIIGNSFLSSEAFSTVLAQVEGCLNSRPITPLSNDPNDTQVLTPGHFLIGRPINAMPEPDYTSVPENRLRLWERIQRYTQHFWRRWQLEYLTTLQQRYKWSTVTRNLIVGSLVLLQEDSLPVQKWSTARVVDIHPDAEGVVRVVSVRLPSGTITRRSVSRLCLLPIEADPQIIDNNITSTGSTRGDSGLNNTSAGADGATQADTSAADSTSGDGE